jgi:NAD(P)-dependent dehydrogenase (short-subunit alcohol dehydrogenase family)
MAFQTASAGSQTSSTITQTRIAIVTGGAQGIGRAISLRLALDGLDVVVVDLPIKLEGLQAVSKEIESLGRKSVVITADVSKEEDVKAMVENAVNEFGRLDVMVANAGLMPGLAPIDSADIKDWDRIWLVNIRGTALCYKHAAIQMIKQGFGGRIIGASSIAGKKGGASIAGYSASKFAVRGLTQSAAADLSAHNITVNAYAPSAIITPMIADLMADLENTKKSVKFSDVKVGQPEFVANAVSFLASLDSHFITGQTINVCGGTNYD